jgi:ankyrin repeat protein
MNHPMLRITVFFLAFMLVATSLPVAHADEIHRLIEKGEIEKAKALLVKDPDLINSCDLQLYETPLHIAVHLGRVDLVKYLLDHGADVNARAYNKFTPLHLTKDPDIVKLLIEHKADIDAKDVSGTSPLQHAAMDAGRLEDRPDVPDFRRIARLLLAAGAKYDLRSAICLADIGRVRELLKQDPKAAHDKLCMFFAAQQGRAPIVKLLLDHGADPEDCDSWGLPVLDFALAHPDVVRLLIQAGANPKVRLKYTGWGPGPTEEQKWTLLHSAAANQSPLETAKLLLAAGVPVDVRSADGSTPLMSAAGAGSPEMVKFLLKNGASVEGKDGQRAMSAASSQIGPASDKEQEAENARYRAVIAALLDHRVPMDLFSAIAMGDVERVRALLKETPVLARSKDPKDEGGKPALQQAVGLDEKEIVILLLEAGAPINEMDKEGWSALHEAAYLGREEITKLLLDRKADVNAAADEGCTPLHTSAARNMPKVARLLLAAGARVNARDKDGRTPLRCAEGPGDAEVDHQDRREIMKLLREHGGVK